MKAGRFPGWRPADPARATGDRSLTAVRGTDTGDMMRMVVGVIVAIAAVLAVAIAGYSLLVIGIDLFGEKTRMTGMGFAVGAAGLVVATFLGLGIAAGVRYLRSGAADAD